MVDLVDTDGCEANWGGDCSEELADDCKGMWAKGTLVAEDLAGRIADIGVDELTRDYAVAEEGFALRNMRLRSIQCGRICILRFARWV